MPKPAISTWIADQRKRHGWKSEELARRLRDAGYPVADGTIRTWEAGRKPSDENIAAMERLFDSIAPVTVAVPADIEALVQAVEALVIRIDRLLSLFGDGEAAEQRAELVRTTEAKLRTLPSSSPRHDPDPKTRR